MNVGDGSDPCALSDFVKRLDAISLPIAPSPMKAIVFEREAVSCEVDVVDMHGAHCAVTIDDSGACHACALLVR